jgi:hypothetical protein
MYPLVSKSFRAASSYQSSDNILQHSVPETFSEEALRG